ncbi:MAG: hypothetical protein VYD47_07685, partial [Actinomycetota bacterium]|nr:hypothetical protein [Actinomycetota bacterium]
MESGQGALNLAEVRENWVGIEFDWATFDMRTEEMVEWAQACGEEDPRFVDPAHPDFQAHPGYTT